MAKNTIAIIGATEMIGTVMARNLAKYNYRLLLLGNNEENVTALTNDIKNTTPLSDVERLNCLADASWEADIIILAVPSGAEKEIAEKMRDFATQKIVLTISGNFDANADLSGLAGSAAEEYQILLPYSKIVKAFSILTAADFAKAVADNNAIDLFITGNDPEAIKIVIEIVKNAGFDPIIAGELATIRAMENIRLNREII